MSASQRDKGQRGEREAFSVLSDLLGTIVQRNVDQARYGGADSLDVPGWAIEIKRQERISVPTWWQQCREQAVAVNRRPALMYRASRQPWRVVVDLTDLAPEMFPIRGHPAEVSVFAFAQLIRELVRDP
jgi:hypothetical protein